MQLTHLHPEFDKLQKEFGSSNLDSIYGAGRTDCPDFCFIFMNPTGKNVASAKTWRGLKAPWIGTKNTWKLLYQIGLISDKTIGEITMKTPGDWDYDFASALYQELSDNKVYLTNFAKCAMDDACHVPDSVYRCYAELLETEIQTIAPKKIITFGNQVSSLFLGRPVKVSDCRKKAIIKTIGNHKFETFPVYYPVGQGMRNLPLAIEDIQFAIGS